MSGNRVLAFPFRLSPSGRPATVERDSDADIAQQIAMVLTTRQAAGEQPAERPLSPAFGVEDPAFTGVDPAVLATALAVNVPQARIGAITVAYPQDGLARVTIEFSGGTADDQP